MKCRMNYLRMLTGLSILVRATSNIIVPMQYNNDLRVDMERPLSMKDYWNNCRYKTMSKIFSSR